MKSIDLATSSLSISARTSGVNGFTVLESIKQKDADTEVIMITGDVTVENVVQAMRKTQQTALYLDRLGPFFVGRKLNA